MTRCKKKKKYNHHDSTIRIKISVPCPQYRAETLIYQRENQEANKIGFSTVWMNSKLDFSEKRQGFDHKSQTETHSGQSYCATNELVCKVRCTEKNALLSRFLLLFWSYRPKLLQCVLENTSAVNISSQDHFLITRTGKKAVNSRVVVTSLLGNFGYQINRKKDLRQPIFLHRFL